MALKGLAVAWFREEDWARWRSIDPDFQPDYDHWLRRAETAFERHKALGKRVVKVTLDPEEFVVWSRATTGVVDAGARAEFAAIRLMRGDTGH